jgi:BirA family biotin operon repressor/biotin-[acetyl-CoA-carboxylase] ligase
VVSLRAALSVAGAIERVLPGLRLALKWPNDLLLGGRKVGGILCEARWQGGVPGWIAVGVGLNVANPIPAGLQERAIALESVAPGITPDQLLEPVVLAVSGLNDQVGLLTDAEQDRLRSRDVLLTRRIREPVAGVVEGISADGSLVIRLPEGTTVEARTGPVVAADD